VPNAPTPHILAVRFSSIGDILLATPLLRALRRRHPEARIDFLTKAAYHPLLSDNPHLDEVLALEPGQPLPALARALRARRPTHLLDLHGSVRTRVLRLLVPGRWSGYRKRKVARELLIQTKRDCYGTVLPVAERYFEAARHLDVRPDGEPPEFYLGAAAVERAGAWLAEAGLGIDRPLVALAPGATHFTKRWPVRRWVSLVETLTARGFDLAVVGGAEESALCQTVAAAGVGRARSTAGLLGLQESGAVIGQARVLVSGDTGVMHMATGVGTPVVALFGPTVRAFGFVPYRAPSMVLERPLDCRPCSSKGGPRCPLGHHRCMEEIPPHQVLQALEQLIATSRVPGT
jgi:heptosyltransferase-2